MNFDTLKLQAEAYWVVLQGWLASPQFYAQVITVVGLWLLAKIIARQILARVPVLREEPTEGRFLRYQRLAFSCRNLVEPALFVALMAIAASVADQALGASWLIRIAQGLALVRLLHAVIMRFLTHPVINAAARWIGLPVAAIYALGYFEQFTSALDGIAFAAGNIRISLLAIAKAAIFGGILFWLGRTSSSAGQRVIRDQQSIDIQTRELAAKALELFVFAVVGLLLLNILGLDLTALAVFGGALGVGLGFGLQQIASNFISGIILLLERSLKIGDYVEMEDGKSGVLRQMNMRSSILSTFDGKDIMVPNDRFITTSFLNWTNEDPHQRYVVDFGVAYDTDMRAVPPLVEEAVSRHPRVLKGDKQAEVVMTGFGDNAVNFAVEFWVSGVNGRDRFLSDVRFLIWDALKGANISMPFPQREVRIVGGAMPEISKEISTRQKSKVA
jgi:small-conductance mechanosensitive channel